MSRVLKGMLAGAVGTAAMDLVWYSRYRRDGGEQPFWAWETAAGLNSWDDASAPGKVGKLVAERVLRRQLPARWVRTTTNVMHWATGIGWAAQYGLAVGSKRVRPWVAGPVFATVVWGSGYTLLPALDIYKPIWKYDARTLVKDWSAHLVYGTATAAICSGSGFWGSRRVGGKHA